MNIYSWQDITACNFDFAKVFARASASALTVGNFDGPHLGHCAIFDKVMAQKKAGLVAGIVTFTTSTSAVRKKDAFLGAISGTRERLDFYASYGFDFAVVIDFTPEFSATSGEKFLQILCDNLAMRFLAEGENFKCGQGGKMTTEKIAERAACCGFEFCIVPSVFYDGEKISSSRIRHALKNGRFDEASAMLAANVRQQFQIQPQTSRTTRT
ncbi:MAG: hypothetical protein Ta2A_24730 [Treponemataceae bacterium]|nr:MAG: hypothetical protein Ta2A_24730 [Treponemataceae bacterium]